MFCFVAIASTYIFGTLLTAHGSLKMLNKLAIGGMLLNFVLNFVLIPKFKAEGSAIASLITQVIIVVAQIFMVKNVFSFKVNFKFIGALFLYVALLIGVIYEIGIFVSGFFIQLGLFVIISMVLAFVLRIIQVKKIVEIMMSRSGIFINRSYGISFPWIFRI